MLDKDFGRVYDLSYRFFSKENGVRTPAAIIVTVEPHLADRFEVHLGNELEMAKTRDIGHWRRYLEEEVKAVQVLNRERFGFNSIGQRSVTEAGTQYSIELQGSRWLRRTAATAHVLFDALCEFCYTLDDQHSIPDSEKKQLLIPQMCYREGMDMHSHPLFGDINPTTVSWLSTYGRNLAERRPETLQKLSEVRRSMVDAWKRIQPREMHLCANDAGVGIEEDGRFILRCFGNACDVAIYPENLNEPESGLPSRMECHNLDAPQQQITLLAGLAALHKAAVTDLG